MSINGYELAFEQATNEHSEIRVKIEQLLTRSGQIEKLLECLTPFLPQHNQGEESAPAPEHHMEENQPAEAHQG